MCPDVPEKAKTKGYLCELSFFIKGLALLGITFHGKGKEMQQVKFKLYNWIQHLNWQSVALCFDFFIWKQNTLCGFVK